MSDRVIVALPDGRWLALARDVFDDALVAGAAAMAAAQPSSAASTQEPLLNGEQAAAQLGVTARWLEDSARAGIVPHHQFGNFRRFRVSEVAAHFKVAGAAPPTDYQSVLPIRRLARQ